MDVRKEMHVNLCHLEGQLGSLDRFEEAGVTSPVVVGKVSEE